MKPTPAERARLEKLYEENKAQEELKRREEEA
jgi:hypothetical protein